jgi:hypothetical protein
VYSRALPHGLSGVVEGVPPMVTTHCWTSSKVQKKLLQTFPFVKCDENTIWSKTSSVEEKLVCQNWPKLLEHLVKALYDYVDIFSDMEYINNGIPQEMLQQTDEALWCIHFRIEEFLDLKRRRALSVTARSRLKKVKEVFNKSVSEKNVRETANFLTEVLLSLTPDDYANSQKRIRKDTDKRALITRMRSAFTKYGPLPETYSQAAMNDALASILIHFGIEKGPRDTLAQTLAKQEWRSSRPRRK